MLKKKSNKVNVTENSSPNRSSDQIKDSEPNLLEYYYPDGKTLHELFLRGVRISGDKPCCGWRLGPHLPVIWVNYNNILQRSISVGSGLLAIGAKSGQSQFIGILAGNRIESVLVEQACNCYSMVTVSIPNPTTDIFEDMIQFFKLDFIFVDTLSAAKQILANVINQTKSYLKVIILMEKLNEEIIRLGKILSIRIVEFVSLEYTGEKHHHKAVPPRPDDLYTIAFTSGTTGPPKGVMISHRNVVACISGVYAYQNEVESGIKFDEQQVYLSYFPFFAIIELLGKSIVFGVGGRVVFYSGDRTKLLEDARELNPTFFPIPPQLILRVCDLVKSKVQQSRIKSFLFDKGMKAKSRLLDRGIISKNTIWDLLVFRRIQKLFGKRMEMTFIGGGSVKTENLNFLRCVLGIKTHFVYGITETSPVVSFTHLCDIRPGSVGPPLPCCVVKLIDAPEQNYFVESGIGEICIKGFNIFTGYYENKSKTEEVLDEEGWFHTGDLGRWLDGGCLEIIDRKINIFILSNGEQITPFNIETVLLKISFIHQIFVYGDKFHNFVVAIVVPNQNNLEAWIKSKGRVKNFVSNSNSSEEQKVFLEEFESQAKVNNMKVHEIPKKVFLSQKEFSVDNGLLTLSGKQKRHKIYIEFKNEIESMLL